MDRLEIEHALMREGYACLCGTDEVGRGPLAGPVVCAAVIMPLDDPIPGVDDSKKLSPARREYLSALIKERAVAYCIERVEPDVIDRINILQATRLCMKDAVEGLALTPGFVMSDGNMTLDIAVPQGCYVKGDARSYTIGAASILAKVERDSIMREYGKQFPEYGFEKHMGYPTKAHIEAIGWYGLCPIHRRTFASKFLRGV